MATICTATRLLALTKLKEMPCRRYVHEGIDAK
jgi:hypothetical protein